MTGVSPPVWLSQWKQALVSIAQLAQRVCQVLGSASRIEARRQPHPGATPAHYVPDCRKAREHFDLHAPLTLNEAIHRTTEWHASIRGLLT